MKKIMKKIKKPKLRDPGVLPARQRKAGPHKDSRKKRGKADREWEKELEEEQRNI
jgi:hypothetical protein